MQNVELMNSSRSFHNVKSSVHAPNSVPSCILSMCVYFTELIFYVRAEWLFTSALSFPSTIPAARSHLYLCFLHTASVPAMLVQELRMERTFVFMFLLY